MKRQKLLPLAVLALGLVCAFPAIPQQSGSSTGSQSQQSAAGGQSAPGAETRDHDQGPSTGWLGLLGLIGLAGLRRRDSRRDLTR